MIECDVQLRRGERPPYRKCRQEAVLRVRLYNPDDSSHEMDLCAEHADEAGGQYPDNIETVRSYA